jgi:hypothetical protein
MNQNLVGNILGRSSIKNTNQKQELPVAAMFVNGSGRDEHSFGKAVSEEKIFKNRPIRNKNCLWRYEKSSPLKPIGQMNQNLVRSILGRSSINSAHLVPIRLQIWPPQAILVSDWLISR